MKKLLLLLALPFVFAACSDDEKTPDDYAAILGKWTVNSIDPTIEGVTGEKLDEIKAAVAEEMDYKDKSYEFKANNVVTDPNGDGTYSISGNKLTILAGGKKENAMTFTIASVDATKLVITYDALKEKSDLFKDVTGITKCLVTLTAAKTTDKK